MLHDELDAFIPVLFNISYFSLNFSQTSYSVEKRLKISYQLF